MGNLKFQNITLFEFIVFIHSLQLASGMLIMKKKKNAKGAFYSELQDFSCAGSAQITLADELTDRQAGGTLG
ncbi:hypothetical protein AEA42_21645 [Shewanella sp. Sh95]|uniref:hypothetical protein n=1 Tax=Shewanella sp. Sh95 TaxID=1689868 RepID=UPI0006DA132C|nr:hypothetical protein [Shewanella sp. Sh95]KPN74961.1 hypothetical protein AEA42_21645 [Shewanella sp. Sh95]